jgi:hypothetical protein
LDQPISGAGDSSICCSKLLVGGSVQPQTMLFHFFLCPRFSLPFDCQRRNVIVIIETTCKRKRLINPLSRYYVASATRSAFGGAMPVAI